MHSISLDKKPTLTIGAKLYFDSHRQEWMILAPERMISLDNISKEIIELCVGEFSIESIVDQLASKFDAPPSLIRKDVEDFLKVLSEKGIIRYV